MLFHKQDLRPFLLFEKSLLGKQYCFCLNVNETNLSEFWVDKLVSIPVSEDPIPYV